MKKNFIVCSILAVAMILIPLIAMQEPTNKAVSAIENEDEYYDGYISVMKTKTGEINDLTEREYLIGVLAAEMDLSYHTEALKAQTVASYTYALYISEYGDVEGADISDDSQKHQGYLSKSEREKKWGEKFDEYEKKAEEIIDSVLGIAIYFNDKPIMSVYHDLSSGNTQSAETVWKKDIPYLVQVESPGDKLSTDYSYSVDFSYDEFEKLIKKIDGVEIKGDKENWIGAVEKNESGYAEYVTVCGNKVSSADLRTALSLRSCCLSIECTTEKITVKTLGNGHMVGMSQYGADYMARQGSDYREILSHYYKEVEIR